MSETVGGERGMVVAPHRAAAEAGGEALRAGGNAIEAMIAAAATIAVVYPHANAIGGDGFWLIAEPGKPPRAIDASGAAGALATRERYRKKGYDELPWRGPDAVLTVAGAVSGWALAAEFATALGGRLARRDLLGDAIGHAKTGVPVSRSLARALAGLTAELAPVPGFAACFMADGKALAEGALLVQERLADTLDRLAAAGFDDFYRGDVAAEIAADLAAIESPIVRADLASHQARLVKPLELALDGVTLFNTPPPTQGLASLILLGLFERLAVKRGESFEHIHGLIEAAKRAYIVRDREITDPAHGEDISGYLEPAWLDEEATRIDMRRAGRVAGADPSGDTVWLAAIDKNGLAVSYIQSLFKSFGSGVVLPRTGIVWHNRGLGLSLDPHSRNPLSPGRKPFHTLNPAFARFTDGRVLSYGSMGGHGQPQFQAQVFARLVRFGGDPGDAVAAPRFLLERTPGRPYGELFVESRFDPDLVTALRRAGHEITELAEPYAESMGHAGAILRRPDGRLLGAADPRSDGAAVAA